ncbi:MAG: adenylate/guanylate cyclase domain-containing protein [Gaiellaceae bacterium]
MRRAAFTALLLAVPLAGLFLLLGVPDLDVAWEHHPSHFWLVLFSALLSFLLGFLMAEAAARRGDARVLLVALAFLAGSGFLALHALATPGVLLAGKNAGFQIASPIGLLIASGFAGASALPLGDDWARALLRERRLLLLSVGVALAVWAVLALGKLPPLDEAITPEAARGPLLALWAVGMVLYGYAAFRYARLYARRRAPVALAVASAWVLLAEAMLAIAISRNWQVSWWEWHLLMLLAFALITRSVWAEWKREGSSAEVFADLYEERTLGREEDLSVLFADLQGFTTFAERTPPDEVRAMLDAYFTAAAPAIQNETGELVQTVGDALLAVFRGDGHEMRAARAALRFQEICATLPDRQPNWPRFRVGVNSGEALIGLVQAPGVRSFTPTGDVVNTGARLEQQARAGEVVVSGRTRAALGEGAVVEDLGELPVKGKELPVRAFVLRALPTRGNERDERLQDQDREGDG